LQKAPKPPPANGKLSDTHTPHEGKKQSEMAGSQQPSLRDFSLPIIEDATVMWGLFGGGLKSTVPIGRVDVAVLGLTAAAGIIAIAQYFKVILLIWLK